MRLGIPLLLIVLLVACGLDVKTAKSNSGAGTLSGSPPGTTPGTTPTTTPTPGGTDPLVLGQAIYDSKCAVCHSLGTYDTVSGVGPNLKGKSNNVNGQFPNPGAPGNGNHSGITLSAADITNVKAFIASK